MAFVGSYLWHLRRKIGSDLVLMPGAMVVLERDDGCVLLTKRADTGAWCLPAGVAARLSGHWLLTCPQKGYFVAIDSESTDTL